MKHHNLKSHIKIMKIHVITLAAVLIAGFAPSSHAQANVRPQAGDPPVIYRSSGTINVILPPDWARPNR